MESKKLYYLESLRGLAAVAVVGTHFVGSFFPAAAGGTQYPIHSRFDLWFYQTPLGVIFGGNFAVCVFFVLSAFVLTRSYWMTGRTEYLAGGAVKRYTRLMPPVAASALLAYVLLKLGAFHTTQAAALSGSTGLRDLWQMSPHLLTAVRQAFYGAFIIGPTGAASYNPPLWTMKIEFLGSFIVFALAALTALTRRRWLLYGVAVLATWNTYFLSFIFGLALADLAANKQVQGWVTRQRSLVWAGLVVIGLILGGYPSSGYAGDTWYRWLPNLLGSPAEALATWHALGAILLVAGVIGWRQAQRILEWRPFVQLGKLSFGLYLTHFIIIGSFSSYLFTALIVHHGYRTSFLIMLVPSLVIIFITAYLFMRWFDQPAIIWSRQLGRWALKPRAATPAAEPAALPSAPVQG
jgi:peptidoglycan/LPS O-acetylase OafA/YrhL